MPAGISRREFIALAAAGFAAQGVLGQGRSFDKTYAYVGSWALGTNGFGTGGGGGISLFEVGEDGSLSFRSHTGPEFEDLNAGYLTISADGRFLYSTEEVSDLHDVAGAGGGILSFAINPGDGSLTHLNTQASMGVNPAMIVIDSSGKLLLASNHAGYEASTRVVIRNGEPEVERVFDDATVAVFPINADGTLAPASDVAILDRVAGVPGVASQRGPHAHSVAFDATNERILVADKGANRLYTYRLNKAEMKLEDAKHFPVAEGVAPRHSAFHPRASLVFVSNERESSLASFRFDSNSGDIQHIQTVASVPQDFAGRNIPSDIKLHPNGNFVYTGNRGHNSISIHRIDESNGLMELVDIVPSGGATPRGFTFDPTGNYLMVANQGSNQVSTFAVNAQSGRITPTGATADVRRPACIKFLQL